MSKRKLGTCPYCNVIMQMHGKTHHKKTKSHERNVIATEIKWKR